MFKKKTECPIFRSSAALNASENNSVHLIILLCPIPCIRLVQKCQASSKKMLLSPLNESIPVNPFNPGTRPHICRNI